MADLRAVRANEIHVWHGMVAAADRRFAPPAADVACLSEGERARCRTFGRRTDQRRFAAVHAGVRRILADYLGTAAPLIRFGRVPCCRCGDTRHGPPRVDWPDTDITFSQSYAGDHWLLAITRGRPVGVDVEVASGADITLLARTCLSPAELAYLTAQDRARRDDIFYTCWTRKEAVLKACGVGLAVPPRSVDVAPVLRPRARVPFACAAGPREWTVEDLAGKQASSRQLATGTPARWFGAIAQPSAGRSRILLREAATADGRGWRAGTGADGFPAGATGDSARASAGRRSSSGAPCTARSRWS